MKRLLLLVALGCLALLLDLASTAQAGEGSARGWLARRQAASQSWNGYYYDAAWGIPVALVVPPTAETQSRYGWGVGNNRTTTINHQFRRDYPGYSNYDGRMFSPTPPWPSDTDQFGVYYVRGPW